MPLVIDAVISNDAEVSGNAVGIRRPPASYGHAEVSGDAEVRGGARVHGHAEVSGHAEVRGGEVSGDVVVTGDADDHAVVLDGMIVDGSDCASGVVCIYDRKQEFDRAAPGSASTSMYTEAFTRFADCGQDAEREANMLVYPRPGSAEKRQPNCCRYNPLGVRARRNAP